VNWGGLLETRRVADWADIIKPYEPFYKDGYLEVSDKPGFGIELDEKVSRKHLADYSGFFE